MTDDRSFGSSARSLLRPGTEKHALAAVLALCLAVSMFTATRSPTVWLDEVAYVDPGVMLAMTGRFVTTAWWQSRHEVFGSYSPLFPLMMGGWLDVFGVGLFQVRSFTILLGVGCAFLFWRLLKTGRLVQSVDLRVIAAAVVLCGYGFSFLYRCGRGDVLAVTILLGALNFLLADSKAWRFGGLTVLGILLPSAGLAHSVVSAFLCGVGLVAFGRRALAPVAVFGCAGLAGAGLLLGGLHLAGTLHNYIQVTTAHFAIPLGAPGLKDPSLWIPVAAALTAVAVTRRWSVLRDRIATAALASGLGSAALLYLLSHFPIYYNWAIFLPLMLWAFRTIDLAEVPRGWQYRVVVLAIMASMLPGLPARTGLTLLEWRARDYEPVTKFVQRYVAAADVVVADFQPYYALRQNPNLVFFVTSWRTLSAEDRRLPTVAIVRPEQIATVNQLFGEAWTITGKLEPPIHDHRIGATLYDLVALRRILPSSPQQ